MLLGRVGELPCCERRGSASRETGEIVTGWEEVGAIRLTVRPVEEGEGVTIEEGVIETEECKEPPGCPEFEFEEFEG